LAAQCYNLVVTSLGRGFPVQRSDKFVNPFYGLLLVAGIAFAMTAVCYGVMAFRAARPAAAAEGVKANEQHPLLVWMSKHGEKALLVELAFLAAFTFGAIGTDDFWQRRNKMKNSSEGTANNR
jgi:hypothetical protein